MVSHLECFEPWGTPQERAQNTHNTAQYSRETKKWYSRDQTRDKTRTTSAIIAHAAPDPVNEATMTNRPITSWHTMDADWIDHKLPSSLASSVLRMVSWQSKAGSMVLKVEDQMPAHASSGREELTDGTVIQSNYQCGHFGKFFAPLPCTSVGMWEKRWVAWTSPSQDHKMLKEYPHQCH